ncbi:MAG TPA: hypothetical protein VGT24_08250 [Candidatus Acidoferrales bacterium]|nr:hypothetical protein [Candidatus Acidoferrales bacterium]
MHRTGTSRAIPTAMERASGLRGSGDLENIPSRWWSALLLVASFLGCGGAVGSGPSQPPPTGVTVSVAPAAASVLLGEQQTFSATVTNSTNTAVNWSVNGIPGGSATVGMISTAGIYTAPANLPGADRVNVQATSAADPSTSGSSFVTITSDISVSVSPQTMPVELGASRPFTATVNSAGHPNRAVTWVLSGNGCAGTACGVVDTTGTYTAPQVLTAPPSVTLTAISVADPSRNGIGTITVTSTFSLALTGPASVNTGDAANFMATLTPAPNSNPSRVIAWSVNGAGCSGSACGTISSAGAYTAPSIPPSPATVQIIATPQADPSKAASISVTIIPVISVSVSPVSATVALGASQAFQAVVRGAQDATVTWDVNGVVGGNGTVGTILNSQTNPDFTTYTAPQTLPAGGSVTVRARSNASPSVSASAVVRFTAAINVALSPASATLAVGHRQTFSVQVNNTPNQNVTWQVNGIAGGSAAAGQICVAGSNPCQPVLSSNGGSVDYLAPVGLPAPNPVTITATSVSDKTRSASASVTILPHVVVSVLPGSVMMSGGAQQRFAATVTGTDNQLVIWSVTGAGCGNLGACGTIDSSGLFTAPAAAPSPDLITIVATSSEDTGQSGTATVTITGGPSISSLAPTSAYAGSAGGFTLLVSGSNFSPSAPGPGSTILVTGTARTTTCSSNTQCTTSLALADLQSAGNLSVRLENPDGSLSNTEAFVVLAPGSGTGLITLTPSTPTSVGDDIVVVDLSTNGGSGAAGNVSLNIAAIGAYNVATTSCTLGGSPVIVQRPAWGIAAADLCVFSLSGLDPSFTYALSGPTTPDITISNREPLGLGIIHLTLQVPATAVTGPRTFFVQNPELDMAAGTGTIEVR